jgi:hypothetical protein
MLLLSTVLAACADGSSPSGDTVATTEGATLRLHDLPRGFVVGDDSGCSGPGTEGADPQVANWALEYRPEECEFQYERLYAVPGPGVVPPIVEAGVLTAHTEKGAIAGLKLAALLAKERTGHHSALREVAAPTIGEEARLFDSGDIGVKGRSRGNGSILYWRKGAFLASLLVAGGATSINEKVVARLAALQQKHIESPTPYTEAERDGSQVPLDDPRLKLPVFWLGPAFGPSGGLPSSALESSFAPIGGGAAPPGEKLELQYALGPRLGTWTRAGWRRYRRIKIGRINWTSSCSKPSRIKLRGGNAIVVGVHLSRLAACPGEPPNHYFAVVYLGKVVLGVDLALCYSCAEPHSGPYDSLPGMKAIVRGLRRRPEPRF